MHALHAHICAYARLINEAPGNQEETEAFLPWPMSTGGDNGKWTPDVIPAMFRTGTKVVFLPRGNHVFLEGDLMPYYLLVSCFALCTVQLHFFVLLPTLLHALQSFTSISTH